MHRAKKSGSPRPQPKPAISLEVYWSGTSAAADGHDVAAACDAELFAADVASRTGSTSAATWEGRSMKPLTPATVKVLVLLWQAVLLRPQTKALVSALLEHGVIATLPVGLSDEQSDVSALPRPFLILLFLTCLAVSRAWRAVPCGICARCAAYYATTETEAVVQAEGGGRTTRGDGCSAIAGYVGRDRIAIWEIARLGGGQYGEEVSGRKSAVHAGRKGHRHVADQDSTALLCANEGGGHY